MNILLKLWTELSKIGRGWIFIQPFSYFGGYDLFSFSEKQDETFENIDFRECESEISERYEDCEFIACNFQQLDLSKIEFVSCSFTSCNLSLVDLSSSKINYSSFKSCKMLSIDFSRLENFRENKFKDCVLETCVFVDLKIPYSNFENCNLESCKFESTDLSNSTFKECSFENAFFFNCNLKQADFTSSRDYVLSPVENKVKGSKHSREAVLGLLSSFMLDIS